MNEWIEINLQKPDKNKIHFLTNGRAVFIKGTQLKPFIFQLFGEYTFIDDFKPTHWTFLPNLPITPGLE